MKTPQVLFEVSWEVCNMVGGIHTVLASKVERMLHHYGDNYIAIGPDIARAPNSVPVFREEIWDHDFMEILETLRAQGVSCKMGRWLIPCEPKTILIDFNNLHQYRDRILTDYWERYHLHSLYGGWDYLEPTFFGHGAGMAIEALFQNLLKPREQSVVVQVHEWMTASAVLYLRKVSPDISTVFLTHATVLGRALSAQVPDMDLSTYASTIKPELKAHELGVSAKHSMEMIAANVADCFTTVSQTTSEECTHILGRQPDMILPNALGDEFQDPKLGESSNVSKVRERLFQLAELTTGTKYDRNNTNILMTAGRYEFKNKGVDIFLDSLQQLNETLKRKTDKRVLAFLMLPAGHRNPRSQLLHPSVNAPHAPQISTHELWDEVHDPVLESLRLKQMSNQPDQMVHVVFVPIYLDGNDQLIQEKYYELLAGADLSVFPSFYEPWGYTPMESIAFGVPTITSDLAGFGNWAEETGEWKDTGIFVLKRKGRSIKDSTQDLFEHLRSFVTLTNDQQTEFRKLSLTTSTKCRWKNWAKFYFKAHAMALEKTIERTGSPSSESKPVNDRAAQVGRHFDQQTHLRNFVVHNKIPRNLEKLRNLARNVWWSWNPDAIELFSQLDPELWGKSGYNPSIFLDYVKPEVLEKASNSTTYLNELDKVFEIFESHREENKKPREIAFFCAEYGITQCLKFYSGGLGILAGDIVKTASDMKLPMCAVGLAYHSGYFQQHIDRDGQQVNNYEKNDFYSLPMRLMRGTEGQPIIVSVPFPTGPVHVRAWKVGVGGVDLYLLDTDFSSNSQADRAITNNLYGGDQTHRLRQELILGIGGLKLLSALDITPKIFHMNEGHSAFLVIARLVQLMSESNLKYEEALEYVRHTSIFTTHTPVSAGHDHFPEHIVRPYLSPFGEALHKDWNSIAALGTGTGAVDKNDFSMTYLCLNGTIRVNGVSKIHGHVSRQMFKELYSGFHEFEIPITSITNGVHVPTWLAPEWQDLFLKQIGPDWRDHMTDEKYWQKVLDVDNKLYWQTHLKTKGRLIKWLKGHIEKTFRERREDPTHMAQALVNLDENPLIIGFARRFAPYKRADLLFRDLKRIESILSTEGRPIIFIFGGKSHPSDGIGQAIIKRIIEISRQPGLAGKVLFVENYEIEISQMLISGCDIWLNTPTRPLEASGTSGMKAGINGCINLSIGDGWWPEAYNGKNGWIIDDDAEGNPQDFQNAYDSAKIYALLEHEIIPMFFDRNAQGIPSRWIKTMKESMASIIPNFSADRMLTEYKTRIYAPAIEDAISLSSKSFSGLYALHEKKHRLERAWTSVVFDDVQITGLDREKVLVDQPIDILVELNHPSLSTDDILVQAVLGRSTPEGKLTDLKTYSLEPVLNDGMKDKSSWKIELNCSESGPYSLGVRVIPRKEHSDHELELFQNLVKWL